MKNIVLYGTKFCPYCMRAKMLLDRKGLEYEEIRVDLDAEQRAIMRDRSGRTSVPQIFIDDHHVGGCDDLYALDRSGGLDDLLKTG